MGDARHKRPPPADEEEEDVTDVFRKLVRARLEENGRHNRLRRIKKGGPGYKVSNQAELADAIGSDKNLMRKMFGGVRDPMEPAPTVDRSAFVGRIRNVLELPLVATITVSTSRLATMKALADLPDELFRQFEEEVKRLKR